MATEPKKKDNQVKIVVPKDNQTGKYANAFTVTVGEREIIVDFGYILPNVQPTTVEVVSRINLHPDAARSFLSTFQNTVLDYENKRKKKTHE